MAAISLSIARLSSSSLPPASSPSAAAADPSREALAGSITRIKKVSERLGWQIPSKKEHFNDRVTFCPMQEPTLLNCGHTFEARTIQAIMAGTRVCSFCRASITTRTINYDLKTEIAEDQTRGPIPTLTHFTVEDRDLADTYLRIARGLVGKERYEEALTNFRMAFLYTNRLEDYLEVPVLYETKLPLRKEETALAHLHLACCQLKEDKVPEAIKSLEQAKKISPESLKIDGLLIELQLSVDFSTEQLAQAMAMAADQEDPEEAIAIYKQVIAHDPYQFDAYTALGSLLKDPAERKALLLEAASYAEEHGNAELALYFREKAEKRPPLLTVTAFSKEIWTNPAACKDQLPPYPQALMDFLAGDCTIWPGKKRSATHIVVPLVPQITLIGADGSLATVPRTLDSLDQLDKASGGKGYAYVWDQIPKNTTAENTFRWAVMTRVVLPNSRNKTYAIQVGLIPAGYEVPDVLSAATAILWHNRLTGVRCFGDNPWTYTRCQENIMQGYQLIVGGFAPGGLDVDIDCGGRASIGVAGLRKF